MRFNKYSGVVVGLNILVFAVHSSLQFKEQNTLFPVGMCIISINMVTAYLLLVRTSFTFHNDALRKPFWIISLFLNGALFKVVQPISCWNTVSQWCFVAGTCFAIFSLFNLGQSFAIVQAPMSLVSKGSYSLVRHPVYLGEMLMAVACVFAKVGIASVAIFSALVLSQVLRIVAEENLLKQSIHYQEYARLVKWKLIPLVW